MKPVMTIRWILVGFLILTLFQCGGPTHEPPTTPASAQLLRVSQSRFGFTETVERISSAATAAGWNIPATHDLQSSLRKAGMDIRPTTVIELCKPAVSHRILRTDSLREVSALMPCRVSIYQREDGSVFISRMDPTVFEGAFGGEVAGAMREASNGIEAVLDDVLRNSR